MIYFLENANISSDDIIFKDVVKVSKKINYDVICYSEIDEEYAYILQRIIEKRCNFFVYCTLHRVATPPYIQETSWKQHWVCTYEPRTVEHDPDSTFGKYQDPPF